MEEELVEAGGGLGDRRAGEEGGVDSGVAV